MRAFTGLLIAMAVLAYPAAGQAALPKTKDTRIVVPKSIGGITLGLKFGKASKKWGSGECSGDPGDFGSCSYTSNDMSEGSASFSSVKGKVATVSINAGLNQANDYVISGPLAKFETKEGISLRDKVSTFKRAIRRPRARPGFQVNGKGKSYMYVTAIDGKRINGFTLYDGRQGPAEPDDRLRDRRDDPFRSLPFRG